MIYINGMQGLGDNVYQRAVLHELIARRGPVTLVTSWPQIYAGMRVTCVRSRTSLRTQRRNLARNDLRWSRAPVARYRGWSYGMQGTMLEALFARLDLQPATVRFDLPAVDPILPSGSYVVVRPAPVRREWPAPARNPLPEYIDRAARRLGRDFEVISVADLADGFEWLDGEPPFAHRRHHRGEMKLEQLMSLVAHAAAVVGGVGWLVPMAAAYRTPMLLLYGGWGAANGPQRLFDPRMDIDFIDQVLPDAFCSCNQQDHTCDKRVSDIDARIERFALGVAAGRATAMAA